jgi:hypothetical protein
MARDRPGPFCFDAIAKRRMFDRMRELGLSNISNEVGSVKVVNSVIGNRSFQIDVANRDYHHLSHLEIDGGTRIYRHLSGPEHFS